MPDSKRRGKVLRYLPGDLDGAVEITVLGDYVSGVTVTVTAIVGVVD